MTAHPESRPRFDVRATIEALRRGPADPLNWFDGRRWRRFFTLDSRSFMLEGMWEDGLVLRTRAGAAPRAFVEDAARRSVGLDDPGRGLARHIPAPVRPVVRRAAGVLLPGQPSLFEALVQTVLGQHLAAQVANRQRAAFVRTFGTRHEIHGHDYWTYPDPATSSIPTATVFGRSG